MKKAPLIQQFILLTEICLINCSYLFQTRWTSQCLACIPHLWCQLVGSSLVINKALVVRPLHDEIIIDILSSLLAYRVLESQSVCRHWRVLTSSPHFAELNLKRTTPSLFLQFLNFPSLDIHKLTLICVQ